MFDLLVSMDVHEARARRCAHTTLQQWNFTDV
jgi:hypothetical protein